MKEKEEDVDLQESIRRSEELRLEKREDGTYDIWDGHGNWRGRLNNLDVLKGSF